MQLFLCLGYNFAPEEHSNCCTYGAGGRSRNERQESHDRERERQKGEATEAKAADAAAIEPTAGVILEVRNCNPAKGLSCWNHVLTFIAPG